jgi:hypothetical protein
LFLSIVAAGMIEGMDCQFLPADMQMLAMDPSKSCALSLYGVVSWSCLKCPFLHLVGGQLLNIRMLSLGLAGSSSSPPPGWAAFVGDTEEQLLLEDSIEMEEVRSLAGPQSKVVGIMSCTSRSQWLVSSQGPTLLEAAPQTMKILTDAVLAAAGAQGHDADGSNLLGHAWSRLVQGIRSEQGRLQRARDIRRNHDNGALDPVDVLYCIKGLQDEGLQGHEDLASDVFTALSVLTGEGKLKHCVIPLTRMASVQTN